MQRTIRNLVLVAGFCGTLAYAYTVLADDCRKTVSCDSSYHGIGHCVPAPSASANPPIGEADPNGYILGSFACGVVDILGVTLPIPCGAGAVVDSCIGGEAQ